jgi:DNA-binding transcriptional regulator YiaG
MAKYKSEIRKVLHMEAVSMHNVGTITDEEMHRFDEACIVKPSAASVPRVSTQKPAAAAQSGAPAYARGK